VSQFLLKTTQCYARRCYVGLKSLKSLNLTNVYPNNNNKKNNNKVKSKPLELRSPVKRLEKSDKKCNNILKFFICEFRQGTSIKILSFKTRRTSLPSSNTFTFRQLTWHTCQYMIEFHKNIGTKLCVLFALGYYTFLQYHAC
jgi:hypothetical protein